MDKRMATGSMEPEDRARKRRKQSAPQTDDKVSQVTVDGQRLLQSLLRRKDRIRLIHKEFRMLPDREAYPDYYEEITEPIALNEIQEKLFSNAYTSLDALRRDLNLMFENAKIYNEQKSQIYKDANTLQQMVREFEGTVIPKPVSITNGRNPHRRNNGVTDSGPELKMEEAMMKVVSGLLNTVDESTGNAMFEDFRNLVSRKEYPEYYKVIKEPMSLNTIRKRLLAHKYPSWLEFERDLGLIVTNAETFNEEDSIIVQLARVLKNRYEALLLKERGPQEKASAPMQSGIKLKLNMKPEIQAPTTSAPKLKLTLRNPRASPETAQHVAALAPENTRSNGYMAKSPELNGIPNGLTPQHPTLPSRAQSVVSQPAPQQPPTPTPPILDTPSEETNETNGVATRPRQSPSGTPKPSKALTMRKSRTPALLPESESITVASRAPSSHLSPPAQEIPVCIKCLTPAVESMGIILASASTSPAVIPASSVVPQAAQPQMLNGQNVIQPPVTGVDPRFRPLGKGIEDALISNVTVTTHPNLNITPPIEYIFPADARKSFQNHVVFFDAQHNILLVSLSLGPTVQGRSYTTSITVNGLRLYFNTLQPNPNRRKDDHMTMACDVRLIPGRVTHIEVLLIAGPKGAKPGMGEQEKFVIDAFLHYE